jgi:hypothetical protein
MTPSYYGQEAIKWLENLFIVGGWGIGQLVAGVLFCSLPFGSKVRFYRIDNTNICRNSLHILNISVPPAVIYRYTNLNKTPIKNRDYSNEV